MRHYSGLVLENFCKIARKEDVGKSYNFSLSGKGEELVGARRRKARSIGWCRGSAPFKPSVKEGGSSLRRRRSGGGSTGEEGGWLAAREIGGGATRGHGGRRRFRAELHPEAAAQAGGRWKSADLRVPADQLAETRDIVVSGRDRAGCRLEDQLPDAERRDEQVPRRPRARRRYRDRRGPVQGEGQEQDGRGRGFDQPEFQS